MQIGSDKRLSVAANYPAEGLRKVATQAQLGNAFLKSTNNESTITHGFRVFPEYKNVKVDIPIASFVGRILFPFGVSFLLPAFTQTLVREKEDRIYIMMKINGLSKFVYYCSHYIHFYFMHLVSSLVFIGAGILFKIELFTRTEALVYVILFFVWGHVQIALAFCFSAVFKRSQSAIGNFYC